MYAYRGVEYRVVLRTNSRVVIIVPVKDAYERLLGSSYYMVRGDSWCSEAYARGNFADALRPDDMSDISLTKEEDERLHAALRVHDDSVESHGWYDVCTITSTLGRR